MNFFLVRILGVGITEYFNCIGDNICMYLISNINSISSVINMCMIICNTIILYSSICRNVLLLVLIVVLLYVVYCVVIMANSNNNNNLLSLYNIRYGLINVY